MAAARRERRSTLSVPNGGSRGRWWWAAGIAGAAFITAVVGLAVAEGWQAIRPQEEVELVVNRRWLPDLDLSCDHNVNVAGLPSSPGIGELPAGSGGELSADRDPRTIAVERLGAVTWYRGELRVMLTTNSSESVYVKGVRPVVFSRRAISPVWGLEFKPPCGGPAQYRLFQTVLDRSSIQDLGVVGLEATSGSPYRKAPSKPLGETFTVSQSDPAELVFHVYACSGYFEWALKITYRATGRDRVAWVGTQEQPLKAVGGWRDVMRYHGEYQGTTTIVPGPATPSGHAVEPGPPSSASAVCPAW